MVSFYSCIIPAALKQTLYYFCLQGATKSKNPNQKKNSGLNFIDKQPEFVQHKIYYPTPYMFNQKHRIQFMHININAYYCVLISVIFFKSSYLTDNIFPNIN